MKTLGIIGAGPAGIFAALEAAKTGRYKVILFDSNARIGRKLLVTGSGRCNLTNQEASASHYHCSDKKLVGTALKNFGPSELVTYLKALGIPTYSTADGWFYPLSNSAANVVEILKANLQQAGVRIKLNAKVVNIRQAQERFELRFADQNAPYSVDRLVVAAGGKAYPKLGSTGELFSTLRKLGHRINPIKPALAPIVTAGSIFHKLQGVRLDVQAVLLDGSKKMGESTGNMIFTAWGLNGPAVMNISHLIDKEKVNHLRLKINFLPYHKEQLLEIIQCNKNKPYPVLAALGAVLPEKVSRFSLNRAGISERAVLNKLGRDKLDTLINGLENNLVKIKGTRDYEFCQASTGGIDLKEVNPETMESSILKGLYFAGEVLDVVGPCGGFNLQWAFTSGKIAGAGAAKNKS